MGSFRSCCYYGSCSVFLFKKKPARLALMPQDRLLKVLDDCDADCTLFMEYFSACSDAYGHDPNFKALMTALTASEDFSSFLELMLLLPWIVVLAFCASPMGARLVAD